MRFTPASILLASALALSASSGIGQQSLRPSAVAASNPKAAQWVAQGQQALTSGQYDQARDAYETALLLAPQDPDIYLALGKIARAQKMPGKAIRYFNRVLDMDPSNQTALQGEGLAMMDKGATESARETLAKLRTICKANCASAEPLAAAIASGAPKVAAAETKAVAPPKIVEQQ
ncbi:MULTISPECIES: tetratricopeptide repeat protein [Sphingobium]|uniref:Cytochrome c-type biogenesis protein CcmH/NrfG n=1 Tax=Sphingobium lignivorans TaxID=2735886 RepID=A0ABR6NE61_9SPHN|nr:MULTISPECIES: tetratricopeptide repeat protein [Sphingobium]MBB5985541.1 cytochrome c-type biogenesis protein CcmH/NrfG [Sphingobium lignivorans]